MREYILIVEDDNDINAMLKELLEGQGYEVAQAFSGTEALLYLEKRVPDGVILELLMENPSKVFTKSNIYESVWNEEFLGEENAVNVHISNIRQKLAKINPEETYIQTVWGIGFKMN